MKLHVSLHVHIDHLAIYIISLIFSSCLTNHTKPIVPYTWSFFYFVLHASHVISWPNQTEQPLHHICFLFLPTWLHILACKFQTGFCFTCPYVWIPNQQAFSSIGNCYHLSALKSTRIADCFIIQITSDLLTKSGVNTSLPVSEYEGFMLRNSTSSMSSILWPM